MLRYWKFYLIFCGADNTTKDLSCLSQQIFYGKLPNTLDVGGGNFDGSKKNWRRNTTLTSIYLCFMAFLWLISTIVNHFSPKLSNRSWTSEWKSGFFTVRTQKYVRAKWPVNAISLICGTIFLKIHQNFLKRPFRCCFGCFVIKSLQLNPVDLQPQNIKSVDVQKGMDGVMYIFVTSPFCIYL